MAFYEVYLPPAEDFYANREANAKFVRQGLSVFALIIPPLWLVWNRLWFYLALYLVFAAAIYGLGLTRWSAAMAAFSFLPGLYLFLEGKNLLSAQLQHDGWQPAGVVEANSRNAAEYRWFSERIGTASDNVVSTQPELKKPALPETRTQHDIDRPDFGLFAED